MKAGWIERFDIEEAGAARTMVPRETGEWCRFEDFEADALDARSEIERLEKSASWMQGNARYLEEQLATAKAELEAIKAAYNSLFPEPYYSWQRDWQDTARLVLGLPHDSTVEDIRLAMALREMPFPEDTNAST